MNIVEIIVTAKNMTGPAFAEAKAGATAMESSVSKLNKTANLAAGAMVAFLGESVAMESKFDSEMTLLSTQAGVAQDQMGTLKKGVLDIAAKVGADPDSLAEALFHVESNFESMGITSEKALKLTETAAKGAAVGHADLVDVTNALTAAVASGIPGVQDFDQAMGVLNATVGVGDMKMQDLANAFGSGMVATVKGFGLTITDVGAALAVFGDNNIRGSLAGNQLRMSVMALAKPISTSEAALKTLGLTQTTLADDMRRGGLKLALEDLVGRMNAAGISADKQGQIITDAFGRKAGAGLNVLVGQMDRLESKYPALEAGAANFGKAWERTQQTFAQQTKQLEGSLQALMISLGEKLIPHIQAVTTWMLNNRDSMLEMAKGVGVLVGAFAGFAVISKIVSLFQTFSAVMTVVGDSIVMARVRLLELRETAMLAGGGVSGLSAAFATLGTTAKLAVAGTAIGLFVLVVQQLAELSKKAPPDIDKLSQSLERFAQSGKSTGELARQLGPNLEGLGKAVDQISKKQSGFDEFGESLIKFLSFGTQATKLSDATDKIKAVDQSLADLVKAGHADLAAAAIKRMQDVLSAQGKNPAELAAHLTKYNFALESMAIEQKIAADSMGVLGQQAMETSKALDAQAMTAKGLKEAISDLNDVNRSALDSMAGFEAAIDAAEKAVTDNGHALKFVNDQLDLTGEKARAEEAALTSLASKTDAAAVAALNAGSSMDEVNAIYDKGREQLMKLAQQMGLTREDARRLTEQILATPDKTAYLRGDLTDLKAKLAETEASLKNATGEKRVKLLAEKDQLEADIRNVQTQINNLHGTTLTVTTKLVTVNGDQYGHGRAIGGIIGAAATGGPRNGMTWVGEQGPELVRLPVGSTVYPAGQSRQMAGAAAQQPGPQAVQLEWVGGNAGDEFLSWLRSNIRIRGGNVQSVLGA